MIYKRKNDEPNKTVQSLGEIQGFELQFPIVITSDGLTYYEVWEVEEVE